MALLQHGFVKTAEAVHMVDRMPIDDKNKRDLRARIRRWARLLRERGYELLDA